MSFHKDLTTGDIHVINDQTYADTTARDADTDWNGNVDNIGKVVKVIAGPVFFLLEDNVPTWLEITTSVSQSLAGSLAIGNTTGGSDIVVETGDMITIIDAPVADTDGANKLYVDNQVATEDLWDRAGTTLSPSTAGDDVSTTGDIFGANATLTDDLTVDTDTLFVDSTNNRVGIGTVSPTNLHHVLVDGVSHYTGSNTGALVTGSTAPRYIWEDNSETTDKRVMTIVIDNQNLIVRSLLDNGALDVNDIMSFHRDGLVSTHLTILQGGRVFSASTNTATEDMVGTYMCDDTSSPRTLTISSADIAEASPAHLWTFEVLDISGGAGSNGITIDTQGSQKINGVDSVDIVVDYGSVVLTCDGSNLFIRSNS